MLSRFRTHRALAALAACAAALAGLTARGQIPTPGTGTSETPSQQAAENRSVWMPVFQFRSGFWVNLHHFLYLQARLQQGLTIAGGGVRPQPSWAAADLSNVAPAQRQAWLDAVDYYAKNFANYDMSFDSFLVRLNDRLGELAGCAELSEQPISACNAGLSPELTAVLEEAAPVYRAHWWPDQNRANEAWIAQAEPLVRQYGGKLAELLALVYNSGWPPDPLPVDVCDYAGPFGAYTTLGPVHMVVSSVDPRNQGATALEVVFREASHTLAFGVQQAIIDQCHNQTKPIPRDLWNALVFYTTRQMMTRLVRGQATAGGGDGSVSYPARNRSYVAARGWQDYELLLERYWQAYLDGETDMETAIARIVSAL